MAKFISASFVLVLLVVTTMINGAYSAEREDDLVPLPPGEAEQLCDDWHQLCSDDPVSNSAYCDRYKLFCSIAPNGGDSPPQPESTLP
ncbi:hypothetical protein MtrunA17_Chr2g0295161 [Medicago truncatula]|uniref:RALF-like protein n=1 Tax=Medicago truncatula TaxID=3880 RepID=G7INB4_MEDTR|nr:RALF-like protein [Medicago truncatula]RHN73127.1 hypothetical protein MtrunA17_Chr2g0295161 [Medicago truncatula]